MKQLNKVIIGIALCGAFAATSCNQFLDREPLSEITPEAYFNSASDMSAYLTQYYPWLLCQIDGKGLYSDASWNSGIVGYTDWRSDNYAKSSGNDVLQYFGDGSHWLVEDGRSIYGTCNRLRLVNWFLKYAEPKVAAGGALEGDKDALHMIGEAYFLRALSHFLGLGQYGDFPILDKALDDDKETLEEIAVREPRNKVARFALEDLDRAIALLKDRDAVGGQRINKEAAYMLKSRIALFEGTFEKYHKGSGRVPGDSNWPGGTFSGNIDSEISFFLDEAMSSAKIIADNIPLCSNSHVICPPDNKTVWGWNPYFEMFGQLDLTDVPEVIFWREYATEYGVGTTLAFSLWRGQNEGMTNSLVRSFLMKNGLPIYAEGSGYKGDTSVELEFTDRDERLQLFGWADSYPNRQDQTFNDKYDILFKLLNPGVKSITGYAVRKFYCYDATQSSTGQYYDETGAPIFRSAEAYLNYIEACYEKTGAIDASAAKYWRALRERAGVDPDFEKTIAATDLSKETEDWGLYSGDGTVDATLFNIRRERRAEFVAENMRFPDMIRWRSFDHLNKMNVQVKGVNFWEEYAVKYEETKAESGLILTADGTPSSNMSPKSLSKYVHPYRKSDVNNELTNGLIWHDAYYLYPLGHEDFITCPKFYQNINWSTEAGSPALK